MIDPSEKERLAALDARIKAAKGIAPVKHESEEHYSQANMAWRMVIELVAGLGIGFGIGFGLDSLLGTMPIFLILFVFLGFAAGIKTMMRTANEIQQNAAGKTPAEDDKD